MAVALVANIANALQSLFVHQLSNFLDEARLVDLIGNLGHNDNVTVLALPFDRRASSHRELPAPGCIRLTNSTSAVDNSRSRKIRAGNMRYHVSKVRPRIIDQMDNCL